MSLSDLSVTPCPSSRPSSHRRLPSPRLTSPPASPSSVAYSSRFHRSLSLSSSQHAKTSLALVPNVRCFSLSERERLVLEDLAQSRSRSRSRSRSYSSLSEKRMEKKSIEHCLYTSALLTSLKLLVRHSPSLPAHPARPPSLTASPPSTSTRSCSATHANAFGSSCACCHTASLSPLRLRRISIA